MSNSEGIGTLVLIWVFTIGIFIASGIYSWNWIEPDGFFSFIGFLLVWGLLTRVGHFLAFSIMMMLFDS